jgi:hypothetical protein
MYVCPIENEEEHCRQWYTKDSITGSDKMKHRAVTISEHKIQHWIDEAYSTYHKQQFPTLYDWLILFDVTANEIIANW